MKFGEFASFMFHKLIITLLLLVLALINAILFLPKEISVSLPIFIFIIGAIVLYREEKRSKEFKFVNRLQDFVTDFKERIADSSYAYSLISISFWIANDETVKYRTTAWHLFLHHLNENLTRQTIILHEKVRQRKTEFTILFEDFNNLLFLLRDFKKQFYNIVDDTRKTKDFSKDLKFTEHYKRLCAEFNKYMDKLDIFSDDVKAEFGLSLSKDVTEHIKDLNELYKSL
jgi:hypothetical protein